jgi:hypothetical protein
MTSNPKFATALESSGVLNEILEDMGFGGLWRSCSFSQTLEPERQCFALTEKLIEVRYQDDGQQKIFLTLAFSLSLYEALQIHIQRSSQNKYRSLNGENE